MREKLGRIKIQEQIGRWLALDKYMKFTRLS